MRSRDPAPPILPLDADEVPRPTRAPSRGQAPCFSIMAFMICLVLLRLLLPTPALELSAMDSQALLESEIRRPKDGQIDVDASEGAENTEDETFDGVEVMFLDQGTELPLNIALRSDLSASSSDYWKEAASLGCAGQLYRSESFLMQGRIACPALKTKVVKGSCPEGVAPDPSRQCPSHDPQCGCHGPIMTRGMVGWAGGGTGPDFFVYTGTAPAVHWAHDHTVIGVVDEQGMRALEQLHALPTKANSPGGMTMLAAPVGLRVQVARLAPPT